MYILRWMLKHLKLDDNNEIDMGFGVVSLCVWTTGLTFIAGVFYALIRLWALCFILSAICLVSFALYLYCRQGKRYAYIITYLFMCLASVLIHFFTTYYLGNCGTEFFVVAALLGPHIYHLLTQRDTFILCVVLVLLINLIYWMNLFVTPVYVDMVRTPFRMVLSNMGLVTFVILLYLNVSSRDFIEEARQKRIEDASQEVVLDVLTGLGNRRMLEQHRAEFEQMVSEDFPLCIAAMDIDHFKNINDTYGHIAGDRILEFIAQKMRDSFRKGDLLIRWGGEEFLILLRRTGIKDGSVLMENFRRSVQGAPVNADGVPIQVHVTIGVKEHRPNTALEDSIKRADELMYQGKLHGRNRVVWERK